MCWILEAAEVELMLGVKVEPISPTPSRDIAALVYVAQKIRGIHNAPPFKSGAWGRCL